MKPIDASQLIEKLEKLIKAEEERMEKESCFMDTYQIVGCNVTKGTLKEVIDMIKESPILEYADKKDKYEYR